MAKNDKLINSLLEVARRNRYEQIRQASEKDTPQIYAAIVLALYRLLDVSEHEEKVEMIETVLSESQSIWFDAVENNKDILQMCEDESGICVRGGKDERL